VPVSEVDVVVPELEPPFEALEVFEVPVDDVELVVPLDDEFDELLLASESLSESAESPPQRCEPPVVSEPNRKTRCSLAVPVELLELLASVVLDELLLRLEELPSLELLPLPLDVEPQPEFLELPLWLSLVLPCHMAAANPCADKSTRLSQISAAAT
jgi:hypothetical protein